MVFSLAVALSSGWAGVGCLYVLFFFESICYPVRPFILIFVARNGLVQPILAVHFHARNEEPWRAYKARVRLDCYGCRRWSMVPSSSGGSRRDCEHQTLLPCSFHWIHCHVHLRHVRHDLTSTLDVSDLGGCTRHRGLVVDQSIKQGFHWYSIDETAQTRIAVASAFPPSVLMVDGALPPNLEAQWQGSPVDKKSLNESEKAIEEFNERA